MRPVDKGPAPDTFTSYGQAKQPLLNRLGDYCSYCERQIETNLAIEHVQPKSLEPGLELEWSNFLLGCNNCNSSKSNTPVDLDDFLWPDTDNTLRAFIVKEGGIVEPAAGLPPQLEDKARATIHLVGLDKYPTNPGREPTEADRRWLRRIQALEKAAYARAYLQRIDDEEARTLIVRWAQDAGMFSIWYAVFAGDSDMRRRLIDAFDGTAPNCFDANANPIARPGGQL